MEALNDHLTSYPGTPDDFVFSAPDGGPLRIQNFRCRTWSPAVTAAGLGHVTLHTMKHSAVSFWYAAGANHLQVTRWAGHKNSAFTMNRYGHLLPDTADEVSVNLDALATRATETETATFARLA